MPLPGQKRQDRLLIRKRNIISLLEVDESQHKGYLPQEESLENQKTLLCVHFNRNRYNLGKTWPDPQAHFRYKDLSKVLEQYESASNLEKRSLILVETENK